MLGIFILLMMKDYVDRFLNSNLSDKEIREIGLKPWTSAIIDRTMFLTGGSLTGIRKIFTMDCPFLQI